MRSRRQLPSRLGFWILCLGVYVATATAIRAALSVWRLSEGAIDWPGLVLAWPLGLADDAAMAVALGLPFLAGLYILARPLSWPGLGWLAHFILLALLGVLVFSAVAELIFWNEFDSRFNGIAVHYLLFPREVIGNIGQSFDMRILLPLVALATLALYLRPLGWRLSVALAAPRRQGDWRRAASVGLAGVLLAAPVLALGPIEPSQDRAVNEIARNGMHSLIRAFLTNDSRYDGVYAGIGEDAARPLVRALVAQDNTEFLAPADGRGVLRRVDNGATPKRLNIVLVIEESFGSVYFDDSAEGPAISPQWHLLAEQGLSFSNIYATGDRTVRGLEALLTSFPPIPGVSTARRSGSEGMHSLPFLLKRLGYRTAFLYGGIKLFDNMGYYWSTIGFDAVWDQSDIADQGFATIWGVADEYLFTEALARLDANARPDAPFFLALLTVSNHRPYTYPAGRIAQDPAAKRREHAAAYADWSLGDFIARAQTKPWFDDTIFIFIGDHGPRVSGAARVPVEAFRVPLLFYAPKHVEAARDARLGSSLDVAPTLLGLLGQSHDSPFFGIDLRRPSKDSGNGAERIVMAHNFDVAFGDGRHVAVLTPKGDIRSYAMQVGPYPLTPAIDAPQALKDTAIALTQTAHRLFYGRQYHEPISAATR